MISLGITFNAKEAEQAIARMRGSEMAALITRSLEIRGNEARREAVSEFVSIGVGKGIFGRKDRGAWLLITLGKVEQHGDSLAIPLEASGFAALQETGGRTKAHTIRANQEHYRALAKKYAGRRAGERFAGLARRSKKTVLAIPISGGFGFGGEMIFRQKVNHPGSSIPKHPFLQAAAQRASMRVREDILRGALAVWEGRAA